MPCNQIASIRAFPGASQGIARLVLAQWASTITRRSNSACCSGLVCADLAEALFAAGTNWTPDVRARDLTDYGISYLTLAVDWAGSAFKRLIGAYACGATT